MTHHRTSRAAAGIVLTLSLALTTGLAPGLAASADTDPPPKPAPSEPPLILQDDPGTREPERVPTDVQPALPDTPVPTNDAYATPLTIVDVGGSTPWRATGTLVGATLQSGEPTSIAPGNGNRIRASVWFAWKAPQSGTIYATTAGSGTFDTSLAIFTGSTLSTAKRLAVNDDHASDYLATIVGFPVTKGTTYRFQVGWVTAPVGTVTLTIRANLVPPLNDAKANATTVSGTSWAVTGATYGSTLESVWEPSDNPIYPTFPRQNSLWWKWTPTAGAVVTLSTLGSTRDSVLAVFRSSATSGFTQIAFDDQGAGESDALLVGLQLQAGATYYFQVGSIGGPGTVKLSMTGSYTGPEITSISRNTANKNGGTKITITGKRLTGTTYVLIDGYQSAFVVVSSTKITATLPAMAKGVYYLQAYHPSNGYSRATSAHAITFS